MGQFVSRIHNKQDDKLYNILPTGDMPTVVFGRVIKPNSVPGMMYYFSDGVVKRKILDGEEGGGNGYIPCSNREGKPYFERGVIFTIPENFNFSDMDNNNFISEHTRSAKQLNANTTSPNYVIRNGEIICVKMLNIKDNIYETYGARTLIYGKNLKFLVIYRRGTKKRGKKGVYIKKYVRHLVSVSGNIFNNFPHSNRLTIIPIGRIKNKKSIFKYKLRKTITSFYEDKGKMIWKYVIVN